MSSDRWIRVVLWCSVALNLFGTVLFGAAATGRPTTMLPLNLPPFYAAQLGLTIALFGGVYAWLALQAAINRPLLMVGALGKLGFFTVCGVYWAAGDLAWTVVVNVTPDLILGATYLWWLQSTA